MKDYKQAKIPKGSVEVRMRGSSEDKGTMSVKLIVPTHYAGLALTYLAKAPQVKKVRRSPNTN
jgi:hypothetical protein